jgi:hypothetical protein
MPIIPDNGLISVHSAPVLDVQDAGTVVRFSDDDGIGSQSGRVTVAGLYVQFSISMIAKGQFVYARGAV